jgi:hypothetical protein
MAAPGYNFQWRTFRHEVKIWVSQLPYCIRNPFLSYDEYAWLLKPFGKPSGVGGGDFFGLDISEWPK